jgi:hypothetical protein
MAFFAANRVKVSTVTTGTSDFVVGAATSTAFRSFAGASVPNGATVHYTAFTSSEFECGEGVYTSGTTTLARTTIFASSNSNNKVSFASAPTIIISPLAEEVHTAYSPLVPSSNDGYALGSSSVGWSDLYLAEGGVVNINSLNHTPRMRLTANTTFYVSPTGDNADDGLTVGTPWQTVQYACDWLRNNVDSRGYIVTLKLANGTYSEAVELLPMLHHSGKRDDGQVNYYVIEGNTSSPSSVVLEGLWARWNAMIYVTGITFGDDSLVSGELCELSIGPACRFVGDGSFWGAQIVAYDAARLSIFDDYEIAGDAPIHMAINRVCTVTFFNSPTVTLTGTPAFSECFAEANGASRMEFDNVTFSGSATGARYSVSDHASITSTDTLPGDADGFQARFGLYNRTMNVWEVIESGNLSGTVVDVNDIDSTRYKEIVVVVIGASSNAAAAQVYLRLDTNNGASYDATGYVSVASYATTNGGAAISATTTNTFAQIGYADTATNTSTGWCKITGIEEGAYPTCTYAFVSNEGDNGAGTGFYNSTTAVNAIGIHVDVGSFDAGTYSVRGRLN